MQTVRLPRSKRVDWALALDRPSLDEPVLRVDSIMSKDVVSCQLSDSLGVAAQIMWEKDCGCVPVVDSEGRVVSIVTDRDVCMAAYTQGKQLHDMAIADIGSRELHTCHRDEPVSDAVTTMAIAQVRRLPVVDADGLLVGVLALSDLIRHAWTHRLRGQNDAPDLAVLLESVSRPREPHDGALTPMNDDQRERLAEFDAL